MKRLTYSNSMQKRRHRHKLILPLWCILLLVTGCGNLYTGDESLYDPNHQDNQGDQTQLPVMVAFSDPIYNVLTRGTGVLDPTDETNFSKRIADGTFFVYAFRRDNPNGMTYAHRRAEDADRRYCLIDGSLDEISAEECTALGLTAEQCKLHGKRAAYAGNGSFINWKSSGYIPYYNLQEEFDAFNFFAYYYDNAQVGEVKREADRICFDVTVDGSQDLMCAAAKGECFRAYRHPKDSYEDHSLFLKRGARYAFLFKLKITDYKGWARGLKKAGYATDPSYANRLITIIEDYDLYKYDSRGMSKREARKWEKELKKKPWLANPHQVYIANDIAYVVARDGDTFQFLGKEFDISWRKLVKYNDLHKEYTLEAGDIIYLKDKRKKAAKPHTVYIVKDGDSMHSISQKYGIRLKNLYKMNRKDAEYVPEVGDRLRLR
mgnify:CR=1 FL=1